MSKNDGGTAFPCSQDVRLQDSGMTLRDWFAGMALAGMAALYTQAGGTSEDISKANSAVAYLMADAMLTERAR
jgi:hypothetical protein